MAAMQTPDGMTYVARPKEGAGIEIVGRPSSYWVDPARAEGPTLRERYWSPTVLVRVSNAMWTVEPDACTELRPADASTLRPRG